MINPHAHDSLTDFEVDFVRLSPIYAKFVGAQRLRQIIQDALENHECVLCKIYELKARGEIKYPSRCATHYDKSLLSERGRRVFMQGLRPVRVAARNRLRRKGQSDTQRSEGPFKCNHGKIHSLAMTTKRWQTNCSVFSAPLRPGHGERNFRSCAR